MWFEIAANSLIAAAATFYLVGWCLLMLHRSRAGWTLNVCAWSLTLVVTLLNGIAVKGPPLGNMYQVIVILSLCFMPLFLWIAKRGRMLWVAPYFCIMAALPLIGALFMQKDAHWRRMPALLSHWFVPHVLAYMIAYALATVAFALLVAKWAFRRRVKREIYSAAEHATLRLAFPFMTFGMLSGALWAEEAWGQYWSWDPKETWSLVMWMCYLIFLHMQTSRTFRRYVDIPHLLGFVALLITFFLVNLLPRLSSLLHGYA